YHRHSSTERMMTSDKDDGRIESVLQENRVFDPPMDHAQRVSGTLVRSMEQYHQRWQESLRNPEAFWAEEASRLRWHRAWDRVLDAGSKVIITQDGAWRRGKIIPLKANVDEAAERLPGLETVIVLRRCGNAVEWTAGRDMDWRDVVDSATEIPCVPVEANERAFLLYTSGSTGKPKGIVHAAGGYLVHVTSTARHVFDVKPNVGHL